MTIFQNIIYNQIINYLIHNYCNNDSIIVFNKFNNNKQYINNIIEISVVCKKWFEIVSKLLSYQLNEKNQNLLNSFIESNKTQQQSFKLIKLDDLKNSIKKYQLYQYKFKETDNLYKRILIENCFDFNELPKDWKRVSTNNGMVYYLNQYTKETSWEHPIERNKLSVKLLESIDEQYNKNKNIKFILGYTNKEFLQYFDQIEMESNRIQHLIIDDRSMKFKMFYKILQLNKIKEKTIHLLNITKRIATFDFSFESSLLNNQKKINLNNLFSSIYNTIENDLLISPNSKLKKQIININSISLEDILGLYNVDGLLTSLGIEEKSMQVLNEFKSIIKLLSNDETLRSIGIEHLCLINECRCYPRNQKLNIESIFNEYKQLVINSKSIKSISLKILDSLDPNLIEGLSKNQSLQSIYIYSSNFLSIIKYVLPINNSIKYLHLACHDNLDNKKNILDGLNCLLKQQKLSGGSIDIHSIVIELSSYEYKEIIELIESNNFPIREFYIFNNKNTNENSKELENIYYQIKTNSSIINVKSIIKS